MKRFFLIWGCVFGFIGLAGCNDADDKDDNTGGKSADPYADVDCTSEAAMDPEMCDNSMCEGKSYFEALTCTADDCKEVVSCNEAYVACHEAGCPLGTQVSMEASAALITCDFDLSECLLNFLKGDAL